MHTAMDNVSAYYRANARHERHIKTLVRKTLCKWNAKDFEELAATCTARDLAVAALTSEEWTKVMPGAGRREVGHA